MSTFLDALVVLAKMIRRKPSIAQQFCNSFCCHSTEKI